MANFRSVLSVRSTYRTIAFPLVSGFALGLFLACGGGNDSNPGPANVAPTITQQPASQAVALGLPGNFAVTASGSPAPTYQWKKGGTDIAGATLASYITPATTKTDNGVVFAVIASNVAGSATSNPATLTVEWAPAITTAPKNAAVTEGQTATFTVVAEGSPTPTYQWQKGGTNIQGATSATYTTPVTTLADNGAQYTVVVTNSRGGVSATAGLVVSPRPVAPTISQHPVSQTIDEGKSATFTVTAIGTAPLAYQWRKDSSSLSGATLTAYSIATVKTLDAGLYDVQVSNAVGLVTSNPATLIVKVPSPALPVYAGNPMPTNGQAQNLLLEKTWEPYPLPGAPPKVDRIYRVGYSELLKVPLWSAYRTFQPTDPKSYDRGPYLQDPDSTAAVKDSDFTGSGYSRGHMTPFADIGYRYGEAASQGTMILTNMCPQNQDHNGGIWEHLESFIYSYGSSSWTATFGQMWIITGPVFVLETPLRIPSGIAIPDGFYKIIVREPIPGSPKALAVLTPHVAGLAKEQLASFVTSIQRVEQLTGLNLFPSLPASVPASWKGEVDVRGWGTPFEGPVNVHMIEPSWDITVESGKTLVFTGAATSGAGTIASTSWTFGDAATATGLTASHTYSNTGSTNQTFTVSFHATDSQAATATTTRKITVTPAGGVNTPPTISQISNLVVQKDTPIPVVSFTVGDAKTPLDQLQVKAISSNESLIPNANLALGGTGASRTLNITALSNQVGSANITLTVTNAANLSTSTTFTITINAVSSPGRLIISQYYEGSSNNKWIELTNVGGAALNLESPQIIVALFSNEKADAPEGATPTGTELLKGTLAPGASLLFKNQSAVLPAYANGTSSGTANFNGDDLIILTSTADATAWANRFDVIGNGSDWGKDTSFYRQATATNPNKTFTVSEWVQKTMAEVDNAQPATSERLGVHVYQAQ